MPKSAFPELSTADTARELASVYDVVVLADAEACKALGGPPGTGKERRGARLEDAQTALEALVREGDAVEADGRLIPPT